MPLKCLIPGPRVSAPLAASVSFCSPPSFNFDNAGLTHKLKPHTRQSKKNSTDCLFPPVNEVYESSLFHKRIHLPEASVDASYTILKDVWKKSNYPFTVEDCLEHDIRAVGLLDSRISFATSRRSAFRDALAEGRSCEGAEKKNKAGVRKQILSTLTLL
ncbi:hypothetical protein MRX96_025480 [Rhipicephalus microplus]